MNEHGLRIVVDPRWVVAVPGNDVVAEVARQFGTDDADANDQSIEVARTSSSVLQTAIDDGVWWAGVLAIGEGDEVVIVRATLDWSGPAEEPISAQDIFDVVSVEGRDADQIVEIELIQSQLGEAVRHRQVLIYSDGNVGDYLGFSCPYDGGVLAMRVFSTVSGWASVFSPMIEAMFLSIRSDTDVPPGVVQMVSFELAGESL